MTEAIDVDPVLLAVSDLAVMTACQRAYNRLAGRGRWDIPADRRHTAYERVTADEVKIDKALKDAWVLLPQLATRHALQVPVGRWVDTLDTYTRALLMAGQPHQVLRLVPHLARITHAVEV